jgi:hypothetical protein
VLGNLQRRFEAGPQDWTAWLKQLEQRREQARPNTPARTP